MHTLLTTFFKSVVLLALLLPIRLCAQTDSLLTERHIKAVYLTDADSALSLTNAAQARGRLSSAQADLLRAMIYESLSMFNLEERYLRRALQADEVIRSPRRRLSALYQLSLTLQSLGRHEESIRMAEEGIAEARRQDNRRVEAQLLFAVGQVYRSLKRTDKATHYMQQAIDLLKDSDDVRELAFLSTFYGEMAAMYYDRDHMDQAIGLCLKRREVIDRLKDMPGPPPGYVDQQYGYLYAKLATFYQCAGRTREAADAYRLYAATRFADTPGGYAYCIPYLLEAHRYDDILPRLRRLDTVLQKGDTIQPGYLIQMDHYARTYRGLGDYRRADAYQQRAYTLADSLYAREKAGQAHEYAVMFHTQEQEARLNEARQHNRLLALAGGMSLLVAVLLGVVAWQKQRHVRQLDEKNRIAARRIDELMSRDRELREAYAALAAARPPLPEETEEDETEDKADEPTDEQASPTPLALLRAREAEARLMEQQLYLNPDLRREDVLKALHISRLTLAVLLRQRDDDSFGAYINRLRVEHSVEWLRNQSHYSIDAVATQSGFKSRSTYYAAFQKRFGMTPAQYRKTL